MEKLFEVFKWLITLTARQWLAVVLGGVLFAFGYYVYRSEDYKKQLNDRNDSLNARIVYNDSIAQKAIKDCVADKYKVMEEVNDQYRERIEQLEERMSTNKKNIKEIKDNK